MEINIITPINELGYGYVGTHIVDELIKLGHKVNLFPIGNISCHARHTEIMKQALANSDTFSVEAPCIRIWHQFDMSMFVGHADHIGFPIFELDKFNSKEKHHLKSCDMLAVCSSWASDVCVQNDLLKPFVVPLGVDASVFKPREFKRKPTIFLNIGKWEKRKGHDILVHIFNQAFTKSDNVELWMMCTNPFLTEEETIKWQQMYLQSPLGHKVRFISRQETDEQVANVMQQADCGIFPSRAEGWNLEAIEMMACGKKIIITDYSAHTEFCHQDNAMLVPIKELEPAQDGKWFFGQGNWAKFNNETINNFVNYMRLVHEEKQSGQSMLNTYGLMTANKFSWKNTANKIMEMLEL